LIPVADCFARRQFVLLDGPSLVGLVAYGPSSLAVPWFAAHLILMELQPEVRLAAEVAHWVRSCLSMEDSMQLARPDAVHFRLGQVLFL
jgi:hypothetical protein